MIKTMKNYSFLLVAGMAALLSGCSSISNSDMIGTYKDNNPQGISTLEIKPDGTFSQVLTTKLGKKYTVSGRWSFSDTDNYISLREGLFLGDSEPPKVERGILSYPVEKTIPERRPQIVVDPDRGIAFGKTE